MNRRTVARLAARGLPGVPPRGRGVRPRRLGSEIADPLGRPPGAEVARGLRLGRPALGRAAARRAPRPAVVDLRGRQRLFPRAPGHRQDPSGDRPGDPGLSGRAPGRLRHRRRLGRAPGGRPGAKLARGRAAAPGAVPRAGCRRGRLPPPGAPGGESPVRPGGAPLRARLDRRDQQPRLRAVGRDPRRCDGGRGAHRPPGAPRDHDRPQGQELPPQGARLRRRTGPSSACVTRAPAPPRPGPPHPPAGPPAPRHPRSEGGAAPRTPHGPLGPRRRATPALLGERRGPAGVEHFSVPEGGAPFGSC